MWSSIVVLALSGCKRDEPEEQAVLPPALTIEAPLPGAFLPAGPTGITGDAISLSDVTVNGVPAAVVGGRFEATLDLPRGISTIEVRGTDPNGHQLFTRHSVLAGEFRPATGRVPDALELRIHRSGLDHLGGALSRLLEPGYLLETLSAQNPIFNYFEPNAWPVDDADIDVVLTDLRFEPLDLDAAPLDQRLRLDLSLPSPQLELQTFGTVPYLEDTDGDLIRISADRLHVSVDLSLDVGPQGKITGEISEVLVELPGFDASWDYLPEVVDWLAQLFLDLEETIEGLVADLIVEQIPGALGGALSVVNQAVEIELLGKTVAIEPRLTGIDTDPEGIRIRADLGVELPEVLEGPGYLAAPAKAPSPDPETPLSLVLSDDLVNRALYEAWSSAMIDLTLSTEDGSIDALTLAPLGASEGSIHVTAGLPPVVVERDGRLEAQIGEIGVRIETPGGTNGGFLDVTMSGATALDLSIRDNALAIGLGQPELSFVVRDNDWGVSNETITRVLEEELPIDVLLLLLGNFSFPLPELEGFTIASATTSRDPSGAHTDVSVTLGP